MPFELETAPRPRPRGAPVHQPLDAIVAVLARVGVPQEDLPASLHAWRKAQPGRNIEQDESGLTLVRRGRGVRQSARFRTPNAAVYAIAQNEIVWVDSDGGTRRWRGPAKTKDRAPSRRSEGPTSCR